jgi:hypothetical protein
MAKSNQALLQEEARPVRRVPPIGAQEGLVLTITPQDYIVHWPGLNSENNDTLPISTAIVLPYQEGSTICDTEASTKILSNSDNTCTVCTREVFMIRRSPLIPPRAPDVRSLDELESNISPNALEYDGETESQKRAKERKNKLKEGRRRRARQRKEAWTRYESDLAKYDRKKPEQEAEERYVAGKTNNSPYDRIIELAEELEAISHPNEEQERLSEILRSTALRVQGGRANSRQPVRSTSHRADNQSQWRSAFERLGPSRSSNKGSREDQNKSNRVEQPRESRSRLPRIEQPRESRSRLPPHTAPRNYSHQADSWQEGGAESELKRTEVPDRFPCFAN